MKKGDLIKSKNGDLAVVLSTYIKFFQDRDAYHYDYDYGVADTAVHIKYVDGGFERILQKSGMTSHWEVISEAG